MGYTRYGAHGLTALVTAALLAVPADAQEEQTPAAQNEAAAHAGADGQTPATAGSGAREEQAAQSFHERSFDYETGAPIAVESRVGEIEVRSIEFTVRDVRPGLMARPFSAGNEDLLCEITVAVNMATSAEKRQRLGVMTEFLDGEGNAIDRAGDSFGFKDRAKISTYELSTLKWAEERIEKVRLVLEAKN